MIKIDFERKKWTKDEDDYIMTHNIVESMKYLDRTEKSINIRLYRLKIL
jgi:phage-related protein